MPLWTPNDLKQLQAQVQTADATVAAAVQKCAAMSAAQKSAWGMQSALNSQFVAEDVGWLTSTGTTADQGQACLAQTKQWGDTVNAACPGSITVDLDPQPPETLQGTLQSATSLAVAAAVLLGIYFVGKQVTS
jgi:hypothetical protein